MKIKIEKRTTEEIEVNFPVYLSYGTDIRIMVVDEDVAIHVYRNSSISKTGTSTHLLSDEDYSITTADDFEVAFNETILELKNLI